ncbi:replication-relaxation family protein [Microbacterium sp. NPDC076895]|uniref:replication-relaxation family protein n=1 Tax=Microbacterium sp. NPDC076895 TaxID=3154957 RepID=UPI00341AD8F1
MTLRRPDLEAILSDRDWLILGSVQQYRFLTTRQVARLHFDLKPETKPIPRRATLAMSRLRGLGLVESLHRRIGGVRAGSAGMVWQNTNLSRQLLAGRSESTDAVPASRMRRHEPGAVFLEHTLAVAETAIDVMDATRDRHVALDRLELEPDAWRSYLGKHGGVVRLKPDLAVSTRTSSGDVDHWFIEVDRDTEPPGRILRKCIQYQDHRRAGTEQKRLGVYPAVVWIVPSDRRQEQLRRRIDQDPQVQNRLFVVIRPEELDLLLTLGLEDFRLRADH